MTVKCISLFSETEGEICVNQKISEYVEHVISQWIDLNYT